MQPTGFHRCDCSPLTKRAKRGVDNYWTPVVAIRAMRSQEENCITLGTRRLLPYASWGRGLNRHINRYACGRARLLTQLIAAKIRSGTRTCPQKKKNKGEGLCGATRGDLCTRGETRSGGDRDLFLSVRRKKNSPEFRCRLPDREQTAGTKAARVGVRMPS